MSGFNPPQYVMYKKLAVYQHRVRKTVGWSSNYINNVFMKWSFVLYKGSHYNSISGIKMTLTLCHTHATRLYGAKATLKQRHTFLRHWHDVTFVGLRVRNVFLLRFYLRYLNVQRRSTITFEQWRSCNIFSGRPFDVRPVRSKVTFLVRYHYVIETRNQSITKLQRSLNVMC